jgi:alpha-L-rhamnosidase
MFSDISSWFTKCLAGINPDPDEPGFRHIVIRPNPVDGLEWVKASHNSVYGQIVCNWQTSEEGLSLELEIPVNCHATLYLPIQYSGEVLELCSGNHIVKRPESNKHP